ncbi:MAG TPA: helix-turn-helix domain-containing protein [Thermoplasmata archaeon]|nr:helix-turn-helix domain-containing protein [Thermoplasmata archaeon]
MAPTSTNVRTAIEPRARKLRGPASLDVRFRRFGDRAGQFVRSIETLRSFDGNLDCLQAQPNLHIVRTAFGKWSVEILDALHPRRRASFGELRRILDGISPRVLSAKLKLLEEHGLLERTIVPSRPPRPEYALTERGQQVTKVGASVLRYLKQQGERTTPASGRRRRSN